MTLTDHPRRQDAERRREARRAAGRAASRPDRRGSETACAAAGRSSWRRPARGRRSRTSAGHAGRAHSGDGAGGDVTFAIDERAEACMEAFLAERAPDVAFYSEDRGLVAPGGRAALGPGRRPDRRHAAGDGRARVGLRLGRARRRSATASRRWATSRSAASSRSSPGSAFLADARRAASSRRPRLSAEHERSSGCSGPTASAAGRCGATAEVLGELIDALLGRRGHLRPRLGHLRHDPARHRPARRLRRAGPADDRRGRRVRAEFERVGRRRDAQQLALRPRRRGADPRGGGSDRHRRQRRARSATGRCSAPATTSRCRASAPPTAELHAAIIASLDAGIERLRAAGPG